MHKPLATRTRTLLAALLVLALALCMPRSTQAASIVEFGTRCFDGDTLGSFIEISGRPTESTRNGMRLRVFDRTNALVFDMDAYGARGSQTFQFDELPRRFLLTTAPMVEQLGFSWGPRPFGYADNLLPFALDPVAGRLQLYLVVNGREQISSDVTYGDQRLAPAPPRGLSSILGTGNWVIEPHPVLNSFFHTGVTSMDPPPACFAVPEYRMSSMRLQCEDGLPAGQYIEIEARGPTGNLQEEVTLFAYDHAGTLLGSSRQAFSRDPGSAAFSSHHWLMAAAPPHATGSDSADARLPFVLDPLGGSLQLIVSTFGVSWTSDNFSYGTSAVPLPAPGLSYVRVAGSSLATVSRIPTNSNQRPVDIPGCAQGTSPGRLVVQELALACADGVAQGQFVELSTRGAPLGLDADYTLRHWRRDGSEAFTLRHVLTGFPTSTFASDRSWLLVPAADPRARVADRLLPDTLDRVAGVIELWRAGTNGDSLALRFAWGDAPLARPPDGGSLEAATATTVAVAYPTPLPYSRTPLPHDDCTSDRDVVPLFVLRASLQCSDGSRDGAFVELDGLTSAHVRDTRLGLRAITSTGAELFAIEPLFPARAAWDLSSPRHWLVGGSRFESRTGLAPDAHWTGALAGTPATLQLYRRDPVNGTRTTMGAHFLQPTLLTPGRGEVRTLNGQYESDALVSPERFDGARVASGTCWTTPHPEAVRLAAVFLQCRAGEASTPLAQYVQLEAATAESMYSPDLQLRWFDHTGAVLGTLRAPFPAAFEGRSWPLGRALLVGSPAFASTFGVTPDATLPGALDTLGGRIELSLAPAGLPEVPLDAVDYGAGATAAPPAGTALVSGSGAWRVDPLPHASGITTSIVAPNTCMGECPGRSVRFAVGGEQNLPSTAGRASDTGAEVTYDGPRGTFELASSFRELALRWHDRYVVEGLPAGTSVGLTIRVRNILASDDTCLRQPVVCIASLASVTLSSGTARDSISGAQPARDVELPVSVRAGEAFDVLLSLRANAVPSPLLPASTRARLEFTGLPQGARVRSCSGFDSRLQRGIGAPVVTAEARRMSVAWPVTGDPAEVWEIERRVDDGDWQPFETRSADADQVLRVSDTRVTPGHVYAYRTGWSDDYGDYASAVAESQPVTPAGFAFDGVTPNPSTGVFSARFEIPESGSVQLDVLDVAGRVLASQRRWLAAGRYTEPLAARGAVPPGVYTVRMSYRGLDSWSRVVVLR